MSRRRVWSCIFALLIAVFTVPSFCICHAETTVIPGGFAVAMILDIDGAIIDDVGIVKTSVGNASLCNKLKRGDMIVGIDGNKVSGCDEILDKINGGDGTEMILTLMRDDRELQISVTPYIEDGSGLYKLGVELRDTVAGVGTVTFVKENGMFVALGHGITDPIASSELPIRGGRVYECELMGVTKSKRNDPGEIRATLKGEPIGEIFLGSDHGIFGKLYKRIEGERIPLGTRDEVMPGKAYIITDIGAGVSTYEVEIIKAIKQDRPNQKSMLIRITDKRLLETAGGIVQGMSGSPLMQNGKIVGAVTHVLVNDPTKGYAIYADWLRSA